MLQGFIGFVGGSGFDAVGAPGGGAKYAAEPENFGRGVRASSCISRRYFRVLGRAVEFWDSFDNHPGALRAD